MRKRKGMTAVALAGVAGAAVWVMVSLPPDRAGMPPYKRAEWRHWIDGDQDCQDTRQEVLVEEAISPQLLAFSEDGCKVVSGVWHDPYTDREYTDPEDLDVDHFVALSEAHRSGGWRWTPETKQRYANELGDPDHLIAVQDRANQSKSDKDPARWLPPNAAFHCEYVRRWVRIKQRWKLEMDWAELRAITDVLEGCQ